MFQSTDRHRRSVPPSRAARDLSVAKRDELARLRGKKLGSCTACGRAVFFERNFTRFRGRVAHVRCPISAPTSPAPAASAS